MGHPAHRPSPHAHAHATTSRAYSYSYFTTVIRSCAGGAIGLDADEFAAR